MKLEQVVLLLSGVAVLGAFFLPFISLPAELIGTTEDMEVTGLQFKQTLLNQFGVMEYSGGEDLMAFAAEKWNDAHNMQALGLVIGLIFVLAGPLWFGLHALGYIFRAMRGRQYSHGIFFSLIFLGVSWAVFYFWGQEMELSLNFFSMARIGFWVAFGGMLMAAFSLFFEKAGRAQ